MEAWLNNRIFKISSRAARANIAIERGRYKRISRVGFSGARRSICSHKDKIASHEVSGPLECSAKEG
jgi:hypothetical protein